ncbi:MAG TPA: restriction endonuclease subunit S [Bacteroidales bacterium]|nr:restriction endonuclease subunit S [Bacteroidales bacterium]
MKKQKNIPKLRFPEFEGEWEKKKLGDIGDIVTGSTPPTANNSYYNGEFLFVSPADIQDSRYVTNTITTLTQDGFLKGRMIPSGSIMFVCIGSTIGKVAQAKKECITNQQINAVLPINNNNDFVFSLLEYHSNNIKLLSAVQAVPIINKTTFANYNLCIPNLPEQQKIASFFTAIDQKISQLKRKLTLLELYKKGVMQKIFSQEIRFKDENGQEFPKWEKKRLGDIGKTYNGLTGKSKDDFGQGKPYIQYKQIFDDTKIDITRFDFVNIKDGEKQSRVKYGDVFFTTSSETPDEVGTSSVLLDEVNEVYLNSFCFGYRCSQVVLLPQFSRYLFRNESFRNKVNTLAQGSTRYNMSKNELMKLEITLPAISEQTKIANFLSAIDDKIIHTQKQIEKAEVWKKGLMQQMFV